MDYPDYPIETWPDETNHHLFASQAQNQQLQRWSLKGSADRCGRCVFSGRATDNYKELDMIQETWLSLGQSTK